MKKTTLTEFRENRAPWRQNLDATFFLGWDGEHFVLRDWAGYLSSHPNIEAVAEAIRLETVGGAGTFRDLLNGDRKPEIDFGDLDL